MTSPKPGGRAHRMTVGVYEIDTATGNRVDIRPPRAVVRSWLDVPSSYTWPPCRCPRCTEQNQ